MDIMTILNALGTVYTTGEKIVAVYEAMKSDIPAVVGAVKNVIAVIEAGGAVSQDQWNQALTDLDSAQAALNSSINQAEGQTQAS